jgi:hypothetical protein
MIVTANRGASFSRRPDIDAYRMFEIYGTLGINRNRPYTDIVKETRDIFLTWVKEQTFLENDAWQGKSFKVLPHSGLSLAEGIAAENLYSVQLVADDNEKPKRKWITEFYLDWTEEVPILCVRQTHTRPMDPTQPRKKPKLGIPRFVREISEVIGIFDGDMPFSQEPWFIDNDEAYTSFIRFLESPERQRPIVVVSLSSGDHNTLLDENKLSRDALGLLHTAVINPTYSWRFTEEYGREFSVFGGAIRIYYPDFNPDDDEPVSHTLFTERKISTWIGGETSLSQYIIDKCVGSTHIQLREAISKYRFSQIKQEKISNIQNTASIQSSDGTSEIN